MAVAFNFVRFGLSGNLTLYTWDDVNQLLSFPTYGLEGGASSIVYGVYDYLLADVFGISWTDIRITITNLLSYWTIISIVYLIFDVIMYVPLLAHRWLDKARLE